MWLPVGVNADRPAALVERDKEGRHLVNEEITHDAGGDLAVSAPADVELGVPLLLADGLAPGVPVEVDPGLPVLVDAVVVPLARRGVAAIGDLAPQGQADLAGLDDLLGFEVLGLSGVLGADLQDHVRVALDHGAEAHRVGQIERHGLLEVDVLAGVDGVDGEVRVPVLRAWRRARRRCRGARAASCSRGRSRSPRPAGLSSWTSHGFQVHGRSGPPDGDDLDLLTALLALRSRNDSAWPVPIPPVPITAMRMVSPSFSSTRGLALGAAPSPGWAVAARGVVIVPSTAPAPATSAALERNERRDCPSVGWFVMATSLDRGIGESGVRARTGVA